MKIIGRAFLIVTIFFAAFLITTIVFDWICWHTGYYDQAAKEAVVMD